jgi:hypothetical protein
MFFKYPLKGDKKVYYSIQINFSYHWWHSSDSSICLIICNNCISVFGSLGLLSCKLRSNNTSSVCRKTETNYYIFIRVDRYLMKKSITQESTCLKNTICLFLSLFSVFHNCNRLICTITSIISRLKVWNTHYGHPTMS